MLALGLGDAWGAPYTLPQALAAARRHNETPRLAAARLAEAAENRELVVAALLPQLRLDATYTRRAFENVRTFQGQTLVLQAANAFGTQAVLEARIWEPRAVPLLRQAEEVKAAAALDALELERQLAFDVCDAFLSVLTADAVVGAAEQRVDYADLSVSDAEIRLRAGLGDRPTLTRTELERASAQLARANAQSTAAQARAVLSVLIGERPDGPLAPLPALSKELLAPDVAAAQAARNDLRAAFHRAAAARHAADEPLWAYFPSLAVRALGTATNEPGFVGNILNWNIAFTLSWVLYDGGQRAAQIGARAAGAEASRAEAELGGRAVARQVMESAAAHDGAAQALVAAEARREVALRNAREVSVRFRAGLASGLEQADASVSAYEAQVEALRAAFTLRRAELAFLEALGRWPAEEAP